MNGQRVTVFTPNRYDRHHGATHGFGQVCGDDLKQLTWPFVAVTQPNHNKEKHSRSSWNFTNALPSWSCRGYEGTPVSIEVYSAAPTVEVFINGKSLGKKAAGTAVHLSGL